MLMGIDHGNKQIKIRNHTFISGLKEHKDRPIGGNVLKYQGKYYTLTSERLPYMWDKTRNDNFFILTLFAIAYKIDRQELYDPQEALDIQLAVGLPPAHYGALYERFEAYFRRTSGPGMEHKPAFLEFEFNDRPYYIYFEDVQAYPQAYAAAITIMDRIRQHERAIIVDIGGMTTEYLLMREGEPDLSLCDSLEYGLIPFYNDIKAKVRGTRGCLLEDSQIDTMLKGADLLHDTTLMELVSEKARSFVDRLIGQLRERQVDLRTTPAIFVGGGSQLLHKYIEPSESIGQLYLVDDIYANVIGYERLYHASHD